MDKSSSSSSSSGNLTIVETKIESRNGAVAINLLPSRQLKRYNEWKSDKSYVTPIDYFIDCLRGDITSPGLDMIVCFLNVLFPQIERRHVDGVGEVYVRAMTEVLDEPTALSLKEPHRIEHWANRISISDFVVCRGSDAPNVDLVKILTQIFHWALQTWLNHLSSSCFSGIAPTATFHIASEADPQESEYATLTFTSQPYKTSSSAPLTFPELPPLIDLKYYNEWLLTQPKERGTAMNYVIASCNGEIEDPGVDFIVCLFHVMLSQVGSPPFIPASALPAVSSETMSGSTLIKEAIVIDKWTEPFTRGIIKKENEPELDWCQLIKSVSERFAFAAKAAQKTA